jgi:hypothetical protein
MRWRGMGFRRVGVGRRRERQKVLGGNPGGCGPVCGRGDLVRRTERSWKDGIGIELGSGMHLRGLESVAVCLAIVWLCGWWEQRLRTRCEAYIRRT